MGPLRTVSKAFLEVVRDSVVPAGRLRSLVVQGVLADVSESGVEPLGQLAVSLEELVLTASYFGDGGSQREGSRLQRFPESQSCGASDFYLRITAIPAKISSLKKLEEVDLGCCFTSLPKMLLELSGKLELPGSSLGIAPEEEALPAELGNMTSPRHLNIQSCGLLTVPAFVGELASLEIFNLSESHQQISAPLGFLIQGCPRLREVRMNKSVPSTPPWTRESRAHLEAF